jgi:hypothetical protein
MDALNAHIREMIAKANEEKERMKRDYPELN